VSRLGSDYACMDSLRKWYGVGPARPMMTASGLA
jgi:hypothetical protein